MTEEQARYNDQYGLPPGACNCHHGSARMCPVHTQSDFDAAERERAAGSDLLTAARELLDQFPERDRPATPRGEAIERLRAAVRGLG